MRGRAGKIRAHLTYANVLATLTLFVVLAGGTAFAAGQLAKNSVGKKQLKANAVTTAKIKKNAVTRAKIKNGAVDGTKVKGSSLGPAEFALGGMPYTRVVAEMRTPVNISATVIESEPAVVPLAGVGYTQQAGSTDTYAAAVDVAFDPGCTDRVAIAYLLMDAPPTEKLELVSILQAVAIGYVTETGNAQATKRIHLGSYPGLGTKFAPATAQNHNFSLVFAGKCKSGSGITATNVAIDVIGEKSP